MCCPQMSREYRPVPAPFRGLRVLLVDKDTSSLLSIAKELENSSYIVTTTELDTVAVSILQERKESFDLIMADTNMPEMDCVKFIKSVQLIKDFPIILMYSELNMDMVGEAVIKGACFFMKKPISSKNLNNVWQHVFRKSKYENIITTKAITESNADQEFESNGDKVQDNEKVLGVFGQTILQEYESGHLGDSNQIENDQGDTKTKRVHGKRCASIENDEPREFKRIETEIERQMDDKGNKNIVNEPRFDWTPDVRLKLKEVGDAKGKREARPEEMTNEPNPTLTVFKLFVGKQRLNYKTIPDVQPNYRELQLSFITAKRPLRNTELDHRLLNLIEQLLCMVILKSWRHYQILTIFEVISRKKYMKGAELSEGSSI